LWVQGATEIGNYHHNGKFGLLGCVFLVHSNSAIPKDFRQQKHQFGQETKIWGTIVVVLKSNDTILFVLLFCGKYKNVTVVAQHSMESLLQSECDQFLHIILYDCLTVWCRNAATVVNQA